MLSRHRQQRTYDRHMSAKHLILSMSDVQFLPLLRTTCVRHMSAICRSYVGYVSALEVSQTSLFWFSPLQKRRDDPCCICDGYL